jgi:polar amino acid transport system permease protein
MDEFVRQFLNWDVTRPYLPEIARGFVRTIELALIAQVIAMALGLLLAIMRRFRAPRAGAPMRGLAMAVRGLGVAYINVMRGLPAIVVIFVLWAIAPSFPGLRELSDFQIGVIALGLVYAAYLAEVFRAGIESVDRGQAEAARSLGMTSALTMRMVILPQAVRRMLPPFMNDFIALTKDTALLTIISVAEVFTVSRDAQSVESSASPLIAAAGFYLVFTLPLIWVVDRIYERQQRRSGRGEVFIP